MARFVPQGLARALLGFSTVQVQHCALHGGTVRWSGRHSRPYSHGAPKLAPQEVTAILRANEKSEEVRGGSVLGADTNQLPSNDPIEDTMSVAKCLLTTGLLFGVFDGHGGHLLSRITSQRLMDYLALSMLPSKELRQYAADQGSLVEFLHRAEPLSQEQAAHHRVALRSFAKLLLEERSSDSNFKMNDAMSKAYERYDEDVSDEIQAGIEQHVRGSHELAVMGCCACVAHVDEEHLHVASTGDCKAVLGMLTEDNVWTAKPLSREHNSDNVDEIRRIYSEHPKAEEKVVIKEDRLLSVLAPLRAFGDYNFKWKESRLKELLVPILGQSVVLQNYVTPPYLTAKPEVVHHQLSPGDKFLVIASDGLWERMMPHKVVKMVGEFMSGRQVLDPLVLPERNMKLGDVNRILAKRREGLNKKPVDANAATHLIRNSLCRTEVGLEHSSLSEMLSMDSWMVRAYRDDITIVVVFFDSEYLGQTPA